VIAMTASGAIDVLLVVLVIVVILAVVFALLRRL
jgi:hypothetical protein